MCSRVIDSDKEEGMMKSPGPYRSNSSASQAANTGTFESTDSSTVGKPIPPIQADAYMKSEEQDGLSEIEKAAMELSMDKHRRAYERLASD
ncbi:hypothetical protein L0665_03860 [Methanogenium marinum]|uniref:Uncharacterized protein n=1 Tax=Methanogenium marinum TaxID=348610 RepID=A0A9Q4KTK2_9EURY|nr:hypothetical protein [Methanogenium marinum]MDE4907747.1 hypothetical protein [Methanogenium marinum]